MAITQNAAAQTNTFDADPATFNYTVNPGTNTMLVVCIAGESAITINSVTYGGQSMTLGRTEAQSGAARAAIYYLKNPPTGSNQVSIDLQNSKKIVVITKAYDGVDTKGNDAGNSAASGNPSNTVTTVSGSLVVDMECVEATTTTVGSGQTQLGNSENGIRGAGSQEAATGASTTMSWTHGDSGKKYAHVAIELTEGTQTVNKTVSLKYDIIAFVNKLSIFKYDLRQFVNKTSIFKSDIKQLAGKLLILKYELRQFANKTSIFKYDVREFVNKLSTFKYDIIAQVNKTVSFLYDVVGASVSKTSTFKYDIVAFVNKTSIFKYDLRQLAAKTLIIKADIQQLVPKLTTFIYDVETLATKTISLLYDIRQLAPKTSTFKYDITGIVSKTISLLYDIRQLVNKLLKLNYHIFIKIGLTKVTKIALIDNHIGQIQLVENKQETIKLVDTFVIVEVIQPQIIVIALVDSDISQIETESV